jgi:hypothetical protein
MILQNEKIVKKWKIIEYFESNEEITKNLMISLNTK